MHKKEKLKILIIGFGSIGQKHAKVLKNFKDIKIRVLSSQKRIPYKKLSNLAEAISYDPKYIIIASVTSLHFKYLKFIEEHFSKKLVLVEKPLFDKSKILPLKKNHYFVGYNLRFHPIIQLLKRKFSNTKANFVKVNCSSYLPDWRNNINYSKSNSAKKTKGGGVLLELSHELDYLTWIFGDIFINYVFNDKISNLKIDTDDILLLNGRTKAKKTIINASLNFFSRVKKREIQVESNNLSIFADLINCKLIIYKNKSKKIYTWKKITTLETLKREHIAMLKSKFTDLCSISEALKVQKLIKNILLAR